MSGSPQSRAREGAYKAWLSWVEQQTIRGRREQIRRSAALPAWQAVEEKLAEKIPDEEAP